MKTIDTIPEDIDILLNKGCEKISETDLNAFLENLKALLIRRLTPKTSEDLKPTVRMSRIGIPNRKLWFEHNLPIPETEVNNALKFLYGDVIEQLILFLLKQAGHTIDHEQKEVTISGVLGHTDASIDGVTCDIKSTSNFAFKKFVTGSLVENDPFGYVAQLSSYMYANASDKGAFIAVNKETGQIAVLKLDPIDTIDPPTRIAEIRKVLASPQPPKEKCYEPEPFGKSGNMALNKNCSYCPYKFECWKDANNGQGLRIFDYASGPQALVSVVETPKVPEIVQFETGALS